MARSLPADIATAIAQDQLAVFWAVDLLFDSPNDLYFWSGVGNLSLDGNTYTGAGDLLQISDMQESSDIAAYGATLTLSGIPTSLIAIAMAEPYHGRKCLVKFGIIGANQGGSLLMESGDVLLLESGDAILLDASSTSTTAITVFSGEMDQMNVDYGPDTCTISLAVESRLVNLRTPRLRRYSDADQQSRFNGDVAFEFIPRLQTESLEWAG